MKLIHFHQQQIKSMPKSPEYFEFFIENFLLSYEGIQFGTEKQVKFVTIAIIHNYFAEMLEKENFTEAKLDALWRILSKCCDLVKTKFEQTFLNGKTMIKCEFDATEYYQKIAENMLEIVSKNRDISYH